MVETTDIYVTGNIQNAQQVLAQAFGVNGFTVQWNDMFSGKASRGSKGMNIALGALAQYYELDFQIFQSPDQSIVVRLVKTTSGWAGGVIGAVSVKQKYQEIVNLVTNYFYSQGIYRGRNPP